MAEVKPTVISTFAGCGGSSLGYQMAGFRELLAVEWDDNAVATFRLNFSEVPVYHGDIGSLTVEECCRLANVQPGELDVLDGSPPPVRGSARPVNVSSTTRATRCSGSTCAFCGGCGLERS